MPMSDVTAAPSGHAYERALDEFLQRRHRGPTTPSPAAAALPDIDEESSHAEGDKGDRHDRESVVKADPFANIPPGASP